MEDKKLVLPGEHLASAEEASAGRNTYTENDEIYSLALGTVGENAREADVESAAKRQVAAPKEGDNVYCTVDRISDTKAFVACVLAADLESTGSSKDIQAVLPVNKIRSEHVHSVRDEVRIGDVLKGKIIKLEGNTVDISIYGPEYGVVRAVCSYCRQAMALKGGALICSACERKERRKLSKEYPEG